MRTKSTDAARDGLALIHNVPSDRIRTNLLGDRVEITDLYEYRKWAEIIGDVWGSDETIEHALDGKVIATTLTHLHPPTLPLDGEWGSTADGAVTFQGAPVPGLRYMPKAIGYIVPLGDTDTEHTP